MKTRFVLSAMLAFALGSLSGCGSEATDAATADAAPSQLDTGGSTAPPADATPDATPDATQTADQSLPPAELAPLGDAAREPTDAEGEPPDAAEPPADAGLTADQGAPDAGPPSGLGPALEDAPPMYRVEVRAAGEGLTIVSVSLIEALPYLPPPLLWDAASPTIEVTAAGERVALQPVRLPEAVLLESRPVADGEPPVPPRSVSAEGAIVTLLLPARPDVDRIALLDADGAEVEALLGADVPRPLGVQRGVDEFRQRFPHIRLNEDLERLPMGLRSVTERIVPITPEMADAIGEALAMAAPRVQLAAREITVVRYIAGDHDTLEGATHGNSITLSDRLFDDWRGELNRVTVHEAAHSLSWLFRRTAHPDPDAPPDEVWPEALRPDIEALIDRYVLEIGISEQFERFQSDAYAAEPPLTDVEHGPRLRRPGILALNDALVAGFASPYGSTSGEEDLAEVAAQVSVTPMHPFCGAIQAPGEVNARNVLAWAKLRMAQGTGFVADAVAEACVGATAVRAAPGLDLGPLGVFDAAHEDQVRIASGFSAFFPPDGAMCGGRVNLSQIFFCGFFDTRPDEREHTVYARSRYGPFGWSGEGVPAGWMPGDALPSYCLFELAFYLAPGRNLLGVHRLTRWGDDVIAPGNGIRPYAAALWQDSGQMPASAGSLYRGLAVFTHVGADFVEGVVLFARFGDPQTHAPTHVVPLAKLRIIPNLLRDPCCSP